MLADELRAKFTADPPYETALARTTGREDEGEFGRGLKMLGNDLHATIGYVRDDTVARQPTGPELDFRKAPAETTLTSTTIGGQHVDFQPHQYRSIGTALGLQGIRWDMPSPIDRNRSNFCSAF